MPRKLLIVDESPAAVSMRSVKDKKKRVLQIVDDEMEEVGGLHRETTIEQVGHLKKILKRQQEAAVNGQLLFPIRDQLDPSEVYKPRVYHMEGDRFEQGGRFENNPVVLLQQAIDDLDEYLDFGTLKGSKYSKYVTIKTEIPVVKVPTLKELGIIRSPFSSAQYMYTRPLEEAISEFLDQLDELQKAARKRLGLGRVERPLARHGYYQQTR